MPRISHSKSTKSEISTTEFSFPAHMQLTTDEVATCARLVRLMRHRTYWLRYFVLWLLREEARTDQDLTIEQVAGYLEDVKNLRNWQNWLRNAKEKNPAFEAHPAMRLLEGDPEDDDDVTELNKIWNASPSEDPTAHLSSPIGRQQR